MALQKRETGQAGSPPASSGAIEGLRSPGRPLEVDTQAFFESRLGYDLSTVRVHTDLPTASSAAALNARAYTVGRDIVFGPGEYRPSTSEGKMLLAHELIHTIQQAGGARAGIEHQAGIPAITSSVRSIQRQDSPDAWTAEDDTLVEGYIDEALRRSGGDLRQAFMDLNYRRQMQQNCYNLNMAAAEHYMYARMEVADPFGWPYPVMFSMILAYSLAKLIHREGLATGDCPVTPTSSAQVRWALMGATDGAADYYTPAGPSP